MKQLFCFVFICFAQIKYTMAQMQSQKDLKINPEQYCEGCLAFLNESHKKLQVPSLKQYGVETRVVTVMDELCQIDNFRTYTYIPPKMVQVCNHLKDNHEEVLEEELIKFYGDGANMAKKMTDQWRLNICKKVTDACANADMSKAGKEEQTARVVMDGVDNEYKVGEDGTLDGFGASKKPEKKPTKAKKKATKQSKQKAKSEL